MKVVITINTSWNIYNFRKGLVVALLAEGHEVVAVAPRDEFSPLLERLGCKFININMENKGTNPFNDYSLYRRYLRVYDAVNPDVILQYTIKPNIYGTLAARSLGVPVINNVSGLGTVFLHKNPLYKIALLMYRFAFKSPRRVFFQNNDDLELFVARKLVKKQLCDVLPGSGVDLDTIKQVEYRKESPFKFLMLSRVLYDKGVLEYVEASKILKDKGYEFSAQLAGGLDDSKMGVPKENIENWGKEGVIDYLGELKDVREVLSKCQCAVLPSYREGTPRALLESGAMGKPIVTTNVAGCKEVVLEGHNGFLSEVKSAIDLAKMMEKVLNMSEEELRIMSNNSRKFVEQKFNQKIVIDKYLEVINGIGCK